ncbi:MAG: hypothetical protein K2K60_04375 [Clostridia bacterium]|nr:hypothetical protein [Clostridia bacterium]
MKKTLLAIVLTLALAVSCAFGLAACKDDKPVVVKEGKTSIGNVTTEATKYDLEGTVGNYYTLTATVNDEACMGVYLAVGPLAQGYGRIEQFEYYEENLTVTVYAAEETVSNVVLVLEKVDAPVAPAPATYEEIELSTTVTPELDGNGFVTYKLVIAKAGTYVVSGDINLLGDLGPDIAIGTAIDENGEVTSVANEDGTAINPVEIDTETGSMILEAATYYVTVYAEDSFMIAIVPEYAGTISVGTPVTIDTLLDKVTYKINGETGKYYTLTATIGNGSEPCEEVEIYLSFLTQGKGKLEQFEYVVDDADGHTADVLVSFRSLKTETVGEGVNAQVVPVELENVVLKLVEVEAPAKVEYPVLTLGQSTTATLPGEYDPAIYVVTITDGGVYVLDGIDPFDFAIGTKIAEGQVDGIVWFSEEEGHTNEVTLEAGQYYVAVYTETAFTFDK